MGGCRSEAERDVRTFTSPLAALAWYVRESQRRDGLRAAPLEPRLPGPSGRPTTRQEDRLLVLAIVGCCIRRTATRHRRVLLLSVEGMGPVDLGAHLGCSDRWARALVRQATDAFGKRLRRVGLMG